MNSQSLYNYNVYSLIRTPTYLDSFSQKKNFLFEYKPQNFLCHTSILALML